LSFVHGDFSFGNLKIQGVTVGMIDFEHSHIGVAYIDLAHLFVNLIARGEENDGRDFCARYQAAALRHALPFDGNIFQALILERVAGKMNSMTEIGESWGRLENLLLVHNRPSPI
jgi:thiamine kinase-like enzyme